MTSPGNANKVQTFATTAPVDIFDCGTSYCLT